MSICPICAYIFLPFTPWYNIARQSHLRPIVRGYLKCASTPPTIPRDSCPLSVLFYAMCARGNPLVNHLGRVARAIQPRSMTRWESKQRWRTNEAKIYINFAHYSKIIRRVLIWSLQEDPERIPAYSLQIKLYSVWMHWWPKWFLFCSVRIRMSRWIIISSTRGAASPDVIAYISAK